MSQDSITFDDISTKVVAELEKGEKEALKLFLQNCAEAADREETAFVINQEWVYLATARDHLFRCYLNALKEDLKKKLLGYHGDRSALWKLVYDSSVETLFAQRTHIDLAIIERVAALREIEPKLKTVFLTTAETIISMVNEVGSDAEKIANTFVQKKIAAEELDAARSNSI